MLSVSQKTKIQRLHNVRIVRMRFAGRYRAGGMYEEIPLESSQPVHGGHCRMYYANDYLFVEGDSEKGKRKKIRCGGYSDALLEEIKELIKDPSRSGKPGVE